jgi:hypothetical protein
MLTQPRGAQPRRGVLGVGARCYSYWKHRPGGRTFSAGPALACRYSLTQVHSAIPPRHKGVANNGTTSTAVSSTRRTAPDAAAARSTARLAASSRSPQDSADALHSGWSRDHARDHLVKTVPRTNRPDIPSPPLRTPTPSDRKIDSVVSPIN